MDRLPTFEAILAVLAGTGSKDQARRRLKPLPELRGERPIVELHCPGALAQLYSPHSAFAADRLRRLDFILAREAS